MDDHVHCFSCHQDQNGLNPNATSLKWIDTTKRVSLIKQLECFMRYSLGDTFPHHITSVTNYTSTSVVNIDLVL